MILPYILAINLGLRIAERADFTNKGNRNIGIQFWYWNGHEISGPHQFNKHTEDADIRHWLTKKTIFVKQL